MRDFGDDVFAGAAELYAKYRPAYPAEIFTDIAKTFGLNGQGEMLDLGCGTGEMAIPLANYFKSVLAVDPDSEMLEQGRSKALAAHTPKYRTAKRLFQDNNWGEQAV